MARWRCNGCGGEYVDIDGVGASYFHVCPPLAVDTGEKVRGSTEPIYRLERRPGHRDENIKITYHPEADLRSQYTAAITAEGAGRTRLPDLAAPGP